ncbi:hypothetical protein [Mucilaginibacter paludis]|uniref:Lipoprotein n=1 Tax=Mucilaginibacter paludis DSM 18603 TaxID=714943 RepID=H1Y7Q0_9SPHI|nr:hypothetical protein [Mucilaginibacter paludis]EHQ29895.1 hypothetical protein Mucpa_5828 [Mucilaginibacter paludis DSM 18603]
MKPKPIHLSIFLIFTIACHPATKPSATAPQPAHHTAKHKLVKPVDTAIFKVSHAKQQNMPLPFDDDNILRFKNGLTLKVTARGEDTYQLKITQGGKLIFKRDSIVNISKVLLSHDQLFFSLFTFFDEDGFNRGNGYIINLKNNSVLQYPAELANTCNPIAYNGNYYFVNELSLIRTTANLQPIDTIGISYRDATNNAEYLDTYAIQGLAPAANQRDGFQIIFTPNKTSGQPKAYTGQISQKTTAIVLNNMEK